MALALIYVHCISCCNVTCDGDSIFSLTLTDDNSSLCLLFYSSQGLIKGGRDICHLSWSFNSKCSCMIFLETLASYDPIQGLGYLHSNSKIHRDVKGTYIISALFY